MILIGQFHESAQQKLAARGIDEPNNLRNLRHFLAKRVGIVERIGVRSVVEDLEQAAFDVGLDDARNQIGEHVLVQRDGAGDLHVAERAGHAGPQREQEVNRVVAGVPVAQRRAREVRNQLETRRELRRFHQFRQLKVRLELILPREIHFQAAQQLTHHVVRVLVVESVSGAQTLGDAVDQNLQKAQSQPGIAEDRPSNRREEHDNLQHVERQRRLHRLVAWIESDW